MKEEKKKTVTLHSSRNGTINHLEDDKQQEDPFQELYSFVCSWVNIVVGRMHKVKSEIVFILLSPPRSQHVYRFRGLWWG